QQAIRTDASVRESLRELFAEMKKFAVAGREFTPPAVEDPFDKDTLRPAPPDADEMQPDGEAATGAQVVELLPGDSSRAPGESDADAVPIGPDGKPWVN